MDNINLKSTKNMVLSNQALSCIMVALQKCLLEQIDITEILKGLELELTENTNQLVVINPPAVFFPEATE